MGVLSLWGRIFDELGSPLQGVSVYAYEWDVSTETRGGIPAAQTTTNSKGIWSFALDDTKTYEVVAALATGPQRVVVGGARAQWRSLAVREDIAVGGLVDGVDVSAHQHTGAAGDGLQIPTAGLQDGAVTTPKLADGSVTAAKVAPDVATQAELDAVQGALTAHKTASTLDHPDGSVTDAKIVSVSGAKVTGMVAEAINALDALNATTLDGLPALAFAPAAQGVENGNAHDHLGGDGAQIQHSSLGGVGPDDHHAKVHNHTSAAEGGTINVPKEVQIAIEHAETWDENGGHADQYQTGFHPWVYAAVRYPSPTNITADFTLTGDAPSGGLWDATANAWVGGEYSGQGRRYITVTLTDGHNYFWRVKSTDPYKKAFCHGAVYIRWA